MNNSSKLEKGRTVMPRVAFGYRCQECGQGTVLEEIFPQYKTKVKGYPLIVENARVGVCDRCGAEHFDPNETVRWRALQQEKQLESYLQPDDIKKLRKELGLPMEQFAILLGCTRQSLYNWERSDRVVAQSRMADLFMRLIRESRSLGQIDVLGYLSAQAEKAGFHLAISSKAKPTAPILAFARRVPVSQLSAQVHHPLPFATDTEAQQKAVALVTEDNKAIATLSYDYRGAKLVLVFLHAVPFVEFDAEIQFKDGKQTTGKHATIRDQEATLLTETTHTEEDVAQIRFLPQELLSSAESK
jgi:putative zinc finger/helix-turn-helix YgiT family protein